MRKPAHLRLSKTWISTVSFVLGSLLLLFLVWRIGIDALARDLKHAGPYVFWIMVLSGLRYYLRTVGWAAAYMPDEQHRRSGLFGLQLAGDALAYLSSAGPFLGEPLKATLVRDVDTSDSLGSTLLDNFIYTLTAFAVTLSGLVVLAVLPFIGKAHANAIAIGALLCSLLAVSAFIGWQRVALPKALSWLGGKTGHRWQQLRERLEAIAARMERINTQRPFALWTIFLLAVVAQILILAEVALALRPSEVSFSFASLLVIEGATKLVKALFFFIPGRVGADEGSSAAIVSLLGMGPATGLILSVIRRVRAILWAFVGLGYLAYHAGRIRAQSA